MRDAPPLIMVAFLLSSLSIIDVDTVGSSAVSSPATASGAGGRVKQQLFLFVTAAGQQVAHQQVTPPLSVKTDDADGGDADDDDDGPSVAAMDPPAPSLLWGPKGFELELDSRTFELRNLSVSSSDGAYTQAFVMNTATPPKRTQNALWALNVSDCTVAIPHGLRVNPCVGAYCANTSYELSADNNTLTLRWRGVKLPPAMQEVSAQQLDITVTIAKRPGERSGVSLRGSVALSATMNQPSSALSSQLCLQSFALPTLGSIPLKASDTEAMFIPYYFGREWHQHVAFPKGAFIHLHFLPLTRSFTVLL
jgi:hypothetical protein